MAPRAQRLMDLVNAADPVPATFDFSTLYRLYLAPDPRPHGLLTPSNVSRLPWTPDFDIDHAARTIHLNPAPGAAPGPSHTASLARVVDDLLTQRIFPQLPGTRSEDFVIPGARDTVTIERYPSPLFGTTSRGAHLTAYVGRGPSMKIWIAERSHKIFMHPGMLDTSVAGGVKASDTPLDCIVAESDEEASLDRAMVRRDAVATGAVTYISRNVKNDTYQPVLLYVYDLELPLDATLAPQDDEVEAFHLMSVDEVLDAMLEWRFKPNCCIVMIDFFIRHGIITDENEPDYLELLTRLRRQQMPVPLSPNQEM